MPSRARRGSINVLLSQGWRLLLQTTSVVVLSRLLTPTDYGVFALAFSVCAILFVVADAGLSISTVAAGRLSEQKQSNLFWCSLGVGFAVTLLVAVMAPGIAKAYGEPRLALLLLVVSPTFLLVASASQFRARLNREMRFGALALIDAGPPTLGLAVAVPMAVAGSGFWALVSQQLITASLTLLFVVIAARWRPMSLREFRDSAGEIVQSFSTMATQLINVAVVSAPPLLLGLYAGPSDVGHLNRAYTLAALPLLQLAAPLTRVAIPLLSQEDIKQRRETIYRIQGLLGSVFVALFATGYVCAPVLLPILLGDQFSPAVSLFQLYCLGGIAQGATYACYWVFLTFRAMHRQFSGELAVRVAMLAGMWAVAHLGGGSIGVVTVYCAGLFGLAIVDLFLVARLGINVPRLVRALSLGLSFAVPCMVAFIVLVKIGHQSAPTPKWWVVGLSVALGVIAVSSSASCREKLLSAVKHVRPVGSEGPIV